MIKGKDFEINFSHNVIDQDSIFDRFSHSTTCTVTLSEGGVYFGSAFCMRTDQFQKSVGRKLALTRALETVDKDTRTKIWNAYFERVNK